MWLGFNPGVEAICECEFVVGSLLALRGFPLGTTVFSSKTLALRGFPPGTPVFPFPQKPTFPKSNSTRNQVDEEPLGGCATS